MGIRFDVIIASTQTVANNLGKRQLGVLAPEGPSRAQTAAFAALAAAKAVSGRGVNRYVARRLEPEIRRSPGRSIKGIYFYLYLFMDIFSRKIVGWQVYEAESSELAGEVMRDICTRESIPPHQVVLHSDNGSPMKGATMLATLQALGVMPSFSRPAVSNDNPFSE